MKRIYTTKSEQLLLSAMLFMCGVLVIGAALVLLPMPAQTVQFAHALAAHVSGAVMPG